jgi:hypothetical protein
MKRKIGTQLEEEVYDELKRRAIEERQPIGEVIQSAVMDYLQRPKRRTLAKSGLQRFLQREPFKITLEQFKESMEADFYDQ